MNGKKEKSVTSRKTSTENNLYISDEEMKENFRNARRKRGFTDYKEASSASGVPISTIWKLESEKSETNVGYKAIIALAKAYNVNIGWLVGQSKSESLNEDMQNALRVTGLTDNAVRILQTMKQTGLIDSLNCLLESDGFLKMLKDFDSARTINANSTESEETAKLIGGLTQWGTDNGMDSRNSRVSDHQLIDMYIWKATHEVENSFRQIMKGDKDNGKC